MRNYIKGCFFVFLIATACLPASAGTLPYFPGAEEPQVPAVPAPEVPSDTAVSSFTPVEIPDFAFSGQADIEAMLETAVRASTSTIEAAVYGFTLPRVAQALADARARGVAVRVLVNESHVFTPRRSEELQLLIDNGVELRTLRGLGRNGIMHNKVGIFDGKLVKAGSFNWAVTANLANSENAVFSREPALVAGYRRYFDWMWRLSRPLAAGPGEPAGSYGQPPEDPARSIMFNGMLLPSYSFSPGGQTELNIINAVNFAREKADIAVFSFYSMDIARAVAAAAKRGVKVRVLVDRVQASQSEVGKYFIDNGVPFRWSQGFAGRGVMHNKYAVLDGRLLMTGSFNWSVNAQENNFENMFYTASPAYAAAFSAQFERLFAAGETPTAEDLEKAAALYRAAGPLPDPY
ncbi:MAG: phospholipase D-like domain-containing protein [Elusimicrobiales bacterium]